MGLVPTGRVYESAQQAQDTVKQLTDSNLPDDAFSLMVSDGQASKSVDEIAKAIITGHPDWVPLAHARAYAAQIKEGRSLVLVTPPFGRGASIEQSMNVPGAIDLALPDAEARPLGPSPLSDFIGIPVLSQGRTFSAKKGSFLEWFFGDAGDPDFKVSSLFGLKMLSRSPAPLSSLTGIKPLSDKKGPGDSSFGMKLLIKDDPTPLSSKIGMKALSARQGSRDKSLGFSTLLKNPTPLSSLLNLPLLSRPKSSRRD